MTDDRDLAEDESSRYRLLVEAISDYAIFMLDREGRVASWNPGAERFKGYKAEEILGEHFSRFYPPEDRAAGLPERALKTAATEGRFEHEGWRLRKDGSRFWASVIIDPILAPDGSLIGYAKVTRDQTEKRKNLEELRLSEERFRYLVQGVTDYAIYMLDPEGRVSNWNAGAQRIKGYAPNEIIGQHFSRFYTPEDQARGEPERGLSIAREIGHFEREGIRVRKNGEGFWAHVVIDAIHDESGRLIGFAKVTRDITERKQAEKAMAQLNEELFQSQKMEAIGRLSGGIAHDFNNLLMAITGSLELLRKRLPPDERMLKLLDNAMQGAQRGASLTQRMLAFARRQELDPKPVDLPQLVTGMSDLLIRSLGPGIELRTDFPKTLAPILIDANQLELAILNLAVNAKDAMPEGGRITISAREERMTPYPSLPAGRYIRLDVGDTGSGMDADTLAHATEPFFTTKGVGKGTGLGLAMVRGLTEQSGGTVTIDSEVGQGTTVSLCIPISDVEGVLNPSPPTPEMPDHRQGRPLKILVVDDDLLVAMNTTAMLEDLGHFATEVHSGRLALDELDRHPDFDLMITDQAMPLMTGTQLAAAARTRRPDLPIILATGYADLPPDADQSLPRLNKPFMQSDLERVLKDVRTPAVLTTDSVSI